MQNAKEISKALKNHPTLLNKDGKITQKDLTTSLQFIPPKVSEEVYSILDGDGFIVRTKGEATHSEGMRLMKQFIEVDLPKGLFENGKVSFSLSEEVIERDFVNDEKYGICLKNKVGEIIKQKVNNDNVTLKEEVKKIKAMQIELN